MTGLWLQTPPLLQRKKYSAFFQSKQMLLEVSWYSGLLPAFLMSPNLTSIADVLWYCIRVPFQLVFHSATLPREVSHQKGLSVGGGVGCGAAWLAWQ